MKPAPEQDPQQSENSSSNSASRTSQRHIGTIWGDCKFETQGDYPHNSSDPPGYVLVHGWWIEKNNKCPTHAVVTVVLYGYWCYIPGVDCDWVLLDNNTESVRAKNKGNERVNA